jgi:type IV secretory pathway VirD2 relaxase
MRILRDGKELMVVDGEDEDSEYNVSINLSMVHERMSSVPISHLMDMINENDDADTADVILQTVFFNEIIFG